MFDSQTIRTKGATIAGNATDGAGRPARAGPDRAKLDQAKLDQAKLDQGRLDALLGYALRRAQLRAFADFAAAMGDNGPTPGQLGALLLIAANPGLTQTALGAALGIERSSVVPLIDRLAARGLVRRDAHADRRARALRLAPGGEQLLRRLAPSLDAHERRIARGLKPAERRQLMRLLARVAPGG